MKIYQTLSVVGFMVTAVVRTALANTTTATEGIGDTDGCPEGWTPNKQGCYLYIKEIANSTQANGGCRGLGAQLVSIGSQEENQFILDFVGAMNLPVWIGLFRTTTDICAANACEGWEWPDGSTLGYSQWAADIVDGLIQCVFMDSLGEWDHGRRCSAQRGYVCEQKRILPITTADGCPAGSTWTPNKQSCYLYKEENANVTQANGGCKGLGAHLVSIGSEEENQFIRNFVGTMNLPVWIGLFRTTTDICAANACEGWEWPDGSTLGYSQWAADIVDGLIQCVFMNSQGEWDHGRRCSAQRGYVCERNKILLISTAESTMQTSISNFPDSSSGNVDPTTNSTTKSSDQSSIYTIVGAIVGIVVAAIVLCVVVYFAKTRSQKQRKMQESGSMSHTRGLSTGSGIYENDGSEAFHRPTEGHDLECDNSVHLNTFTNDDADTTRYNSATQDQKPYEDNQAYEKVNNYSEIDHEYTHLKSTHSRETSQATQEDINVVYANIGQK